jgi:hypothetical protein
LTQKIKENYKEWNWETISIKKKDKNN